MTRVIAVLACAVGVALVSCRQPGQIGPPPPDSVTGVIVSVESPSLNEVTSFELKDGDVTYEIYIADDVDYGFPLSHLQAHVTSGDPVTVDLEERNDDRIYALSIEDA